MPAHRETPVSEFCHEDSFALWKLHIVTLIFIRNSLGGISPRTAIMSVFSSHSLSLTCPVSFLADHRKSEPFGAAQIVS